MFDTRDPIEERPGYHVKSLIVFLVSVGFAIYWIMYALASIIGKH